MVEVERERGCLFLKLEKQDGSMLWYHGYSDPGVEYYIRKYVVFPLMPNKDQGICGKVIGHELPSASLKLNSKPPSEMIITLEERIGDYSVRLVTNPFIGSTCTTELSSSQHLDMKPEKRRLKYATRVFNDVVSMISKGNFILHIYYNDTLALEEVTRK